MLLGLELCVESALGCWHRGCCEAARWLLGAQHKELESGELRAGAGFPCAMHAWDPWLLLEKGQGPGAGREQLGRM